MVLRRGDGIAAATIFSLYVLLVSGIYLLPGYLPEAMVRENGPVEVLSAGGYFLFCLFLLYGNYSGAVRTRVAPGVFVFLLGLRELDFHVHFTTMGMFKSRFFISPDVPLLEKTIVTFGIVALLVYAFLYFRHALPRVKKALMKGRSWAVFTVCGVACAVCSKALLDGNAKMIANLLPMMESPRTLVRIMEECLELFIPIFFIGALLRYGKESMAEKAQSEG